MKKILVICLGVLSFFSCRISKGGKAKSGPAQFLFVEKPPVYNGCTGSNEELKNCFAKSIHDHVLDNFDQTLNCKEHLRYNFKTGLYEKEQYDCLKGDIKIFTSFIVDEEGKITDIKVKNEKERYREEIQRVFKLLPVMTPAQHKGKAVAMLYELPVVFRVK